MIANYFSFFFFFPPFFYKDLDSWVDEHAQTHTRIQTNTDGWPLGKWWNFTEHSIGYPQHHVMTLVSFLMHGATKEDFTHLVALSSASLLCSPLHRMPTHGVFLALFFLCKCRHSTSWFFLTTSVLQCHSHRLDTNKILYSLQFLSKNKHLNHHVKVSFPCHRLWCAIIWRIHAVC